MNEISWLMYASIAVWLGIGGYLCLLGKRSSTLEKRLRRLEYTAQQAEQPAAHTRGE